MHCLRINFIFQSIPEYRLTNGGDRLQGRVEVKYRGVWGSVCDDDFGYREASVVCKSLGFNGPVVCKLITFRTISYSQTFSIRLYLRIIMVPARDQYGWMMFPAMEMKLQLTNVCTQHGVNTTVSTQKISALDVP